MSYFTSVLIDGTKYIAGNSGIDALSEALISVSHEHHEIHDGNYFTCIDSQAVDTTTQYWMITTPAGTKAPHMVFNVSCNGEMLVTITEGADRTGTTALSMINRNRVLAATEATILVDRDYSGGSTDGAITLEIEQAGATGVSGKTISSDTLRGQSEFVLAASTKYIIAVQTYANSQVVLDLEWYEYAPKN